jgi:hypothetical protein
VVGASLDHAVFFHRPVRMDERIWQDLVPHTMAVGRGPYTGAIYGRRRSRGHCRVGGPVQEARRWFGVTSCNQDEISGLN